MKVSRTATFVSLALCLSTLAATLAQCGEGKAATPGSPVAQDPQPPASPVPPKDRIRILVSGSMQGRLEPCGCASGQLGGLARRMQHIGEQRNYDLLLEGGDLVEGATPLDSLKLLTASQVLFAMEHRYDALGVGTKDLQLPRADWNLFLSGAPVVASDLTCSDPEWPGKPFAEKEVRGIKVRIGSLTLALPEGLRGADSPIKLLPVAEAWQRALAGADDATRRILMVHGNDAAIRDLIPTLRPAPDLVVGIDAGYIEPTAAPTLVGKVPLVFAGTRGRVLLDVWLHRDATGPHAVGELVPLAGSKTVPGGGGDPQVKDVILAHRHEVKAQGVLAAMVRQVPTANGAAYVGTEACRTCHPSANAAWEKTAHAHAWETLQKAETDPKRYGWPVTAYPDCVSCHVVGFGEQTGFASFEETPQLVGVGCERCHGPGSEHLATNGQKKLGMLGGVQPSMVCMHCHDFEQSPNFVYGEKWPAIQHAREPNQKKK